jgi:hypothetical protein
MFTCDTAKATQTHVFVFFYMMMMQVAKIFSFSTCVKRTSVPPTHFTKEAVTKPLHMGENPLILSQKSRAKWWGQIIAHLFGGLLGSKRSVLVEFLRWQPSSGCLSLTAPPPFNCFAWHSSALTFQLWHSTISQKKSNGRRFTIDLYDDDDGTDFGSKDDFDNMESIENFPRRSIGDFFSGCFSVGGKI